MGVCLSASFYDNPRVFCLRSFHRDRLARLLTKYVDPDTRLVELPKFMLLKIFKIREDHWDIFVQTLVTYGLCKLLENGDIEMASCLFAGENAYPSMDDMSSLADRQRYPSETPEALRLRKQRQRDKEREQLEAEAAKEAEMALFMGGVTTMSRQQLDENVTNPGENPSCARDSETVTFSETSDTVSESAVAGQNLGELCKSLEDELRQAAVEKGLAEYRATNQRLGEVSSRMVADRNSVGMHIEAWHTARRQDKKRGDTKVTDWLHGTLMELEQKRLRTGMSQGATWNWRVQLTFDRLGCNPFKRASTWRPSTDEERAEQAAVRAALAEHFGLQEEKIA